MTALPLATADDPRWPSIVARDRDADGRFWFSVATTGVYCRPSCPSRTANPVNVTIHATLAEARATGRRPCKRCNPEGASIDEANIALVESACRTIANVSKPPTLAALADGAGLSPAYFHRLFKAEIGLTPRGYHAALRDARMRDAVLVEPSITDAIDASGFASHGRFYARADAALGMTPSRFRAGGAKETLRITVAPSTLGLVLVAASARGIAAILMGDDELALRADLAARFPAAALVEGGGDFAETAAAVIALVDMPSRGLALPLDIRGTAFQQRVWQALCAILPGETRSYAEIAEAIGSPKSVRAVAGACAANSLAVAVPCHRVVRGDGALSGYRWGAERKRALLDREAADTT